MATTASARWRGMSRRATGTPRSGPRRLSFCPSAASRRMTGSREGFSTLDGLRSWSDQPINAVMATTARGTQTRTPLKGRLEDGQSGCALGARTPVWEPLRMTGIGRSFLVCGTPGERPQFPVDREVERLTGRIDPYRSSPRRKRTGVAKRRRVEPRNYKYVRLFN